MSEIVSTKTNNAMASFMDNSRCYHFHHLFLFVPSLLPSFWQIPASPRQQYIWLQATLAAAHEHRLVLQGLDVLQPHFTIFRTSSGAAAMLSNKPIGTSTLFSSSRL